MLFASVTKAVASYDGAERPNTLQLSRRVNHKQLDGKQIIGEVANLTSSLPWTGASPGFGAQTATQNLTRPVKQTTPPESSPHRPRPRPFLFDEARRSQLWPPKPYVLADSHQNSSATCLQSTLRSVQHRPHEEVINFTCRRIPVGHATLEKLKTPTQKLGSLTLDVIEPILQQCL